MNKFFALAIGAIAATTLTGCVADGGYGYGYGGVARPAYSRGYADDYSYGSYGYGYGGPRYVDEVIYIDGRECRHDRERDRYYYSSGNDRIYITPEQYSRNRQAIARYRSEQNRKEAEYKYKYDQNKQKLEYAKKQNEYQERQARYNFEQQQKQYQFNQKLASNQAEAQKMKYKAGLEQQKKQWEYQQKANELKQKQAVAEWKYKNGIREDDKKKKKKD
jgi:hypothetical protein